MTARNELDWRNHREMSEELRSICVEAVGNSDELPAEARESKHAVMGIEIIRFDQSYMEFLDGQIDIALRTRGQEWKDRLEGRRRNLAAYVDRELAGCTVRSPLATAWRNGAPPPYYRIKIDPVAGCVVHWEVWEISEEMPTFGK